MVCKVKIKIYKYKKKKENKEKFSKKMKRITSWFIMNLKVKSGKVIMALMIKIKIGGWLIEYYFQLSNRINSLSRLVNSFSLWTW